MSSAGERSAASFARANAWRSHPLLRTTVSSALPGLRLGVAAFVVYCVGERLFAGKSKDDHGHGHGHGGAHGQH